MPPKPDGPNRWILIGLAAAFAAVTAFSAWQAKAQTTAAPMQNAALPYDESADPQEDLQIALANARKEHKRVLVVFGANWCADCRALDQEFHAGGKTAALVAARYGVVKVDVGRFDRNLDFVKLYGDPIGKGIPSVVVVTPTNEVVYQTRAGELADARSMGADGIYGFFRDKADRPLGS
ncbi:MAG: thioredoxin family protein [Burkholderiaceae bacterium]